MMRISKQSIMVDCESRIAEGLLVEDAISLNDAYVVKGQCHTFGGKFVRIIPKGKRDITVPTTKPVTEDGVYVFLYDQDKRFWSTPVDNMFEYGAIHNTLVFESNATRILTAGELKKTGSKLMFNLLSGTYMKGWLSSMPECIPFIAERTQSMLEKTHSGLTVEISNKTFVTPKDVPLTEDHLKKYHKAGFEIRLFTDRLICLEDPVLLRARINATNPIYADVIDKYKAQLQRAETEFEIYQPKSGGRKRKMTRRYCKKTPCRKMGFTQKASCRPYKNCYRK